MEELRRHILSVARRLLRQSSDAEDATHDALVKLMSVQSNGMVIEDSRAFATQTVVRLCVDRLRHAQVNRVHLPRIARLRSNADQPTEPPPDVQRLYDAVAALPAKQAAVVTLRELLDFDYADVAAILGISEESCRTHLKLALRRLREHLGQDGGTS